MPPSVNSGRRHQTEDEQTFRLSLWIPTCIDAMLNQSRNTQRRGDGVWTNPWRLHKHLCLCGCCFDPLRLSGNQRGHPIFSTIHHPTTTMPLSREGIVPPAVPAPASVLAVTLSSPHYYRPPLSNATTASARAGTAPPVGVKLIH